MGKNIALIIGVLIVGIAVGVLGYAKLHKASTLPASDTTAGANVADNASPDGGNAQVNPSTGQRPHALSAPSGPGHANALPGQAGGRGNRMAALNLTPDQQKQIQAIRETARGKIQALQQDTTLSDADKQSKIQAIRKDSDAQQRTLLTPAQQKIYDQMRAQRGPGGPGGMHDPRLAGLNLTADQQKQVQAAQDELREKMRQAREDTTLSPDEQRDRMRQLFQNEQQEIQALLTPEQLKQYQANSANAPHWGGGNRRGGAGAGPGQAPPPPATPDAATP